MKNKRGGPVWAEGIKNEELSEELARRKAFREEELMRRKTLALRAKESYMAKVWPTQDRWRWLWIASMFFAISGTGVSAPSIGEYVKMHFGVFWEPVNIAFLAGTFLMLAFPAILLTRKERRVLRAFKQEHPEHATML